MRVQTIITPDSENEDKLLQALRLPTITNNNKNVYIIDDAKLQDVFRYVESGLKVMPQETR